MANERDSSVAVVHGCFLEGGDSMPTKLQGNYSEFLWQSD